MFQHVTEKIMNHALYCNSLMKSFVFAVSLLLLCYGCATIRDLSAGDQDDFFLVFQFKYLADNGKYINVEDSRFDELRSYEENSFKPGDGRIVNREKHSGAPILRQGPSRPDG